jgi:hypothetical protein
MITRKSNIDLPTQCNNYHDKLLHLCMMCATIKKKQTCGQMADGVNQRRCSTNTSYYCPYFPFSKFENEIMQTWINEVERTIWKYHIELKHRRKWEMENGAWWGANIPRLRKSKSVPWCKQNPKRKIFWMKDQCWMNINVY